VPLHGPRRRVAPVARVPADDHLVTLLGGVSLGGEGGYNGVDAWWTALRDGHDDATGDRLVTVHEAFHATLNDCTAFGVELAATGVVARFRHDDRPVRRLVDMCRTVHESYATFTSLWLAGAGDLALLGGREDYLAWYRDAADLVPLPPAGRRTQLALDEAARACMQAGVLPDLLTTILSSARPDVPRQARPDVRFTWLHELADQPFWDRVWAHCAEEVDPAAWEVLIAADTDTAALALTYTEDLAPACAAIGEIVYAEFAELLGRRGAPTLAYDEHQGLAAQAITEVERLVPEAAGLLRAATENDTQTLESFEVWSRERLVVRDQARPATLHRLEDRPAVQLVSAFRDHRHVFCIARPAYRLRAQFAFDEQDDARLAALHDEPVVAVVSTGTDRVDLVLLSRPEFLGAVRDAQPGGVSVLVNVTLSCLGDVPWRDRWASVLARTGVTALFDLVPLSQFELWREDGSSLRYSLGTVRGGSAGASLFVCELDGGGMRLLLPCTHVTADVLAEYLTRHYPAAEQTAAVFDGVQDLIEATMSHLMSIEHSFDVTAYYDRPEDARDDRSGDRPPDPLRRLWRGRRR
jgi:hypothetical protein